MNMNMRRHLIEGFLYQTGMRVWKDGQISCERRKEENIFFSHDAAQLTRNNENKLSHIGFSSQSTSTVRVNRLLMSAFEYPQQIWCIHSVSHIFGVDCHELKEIDSSRRAKSLLISNKNEKKTRNRKSFDSQGAHHTSTLCEHRNVCHLPSFWHWCESVSA